MDTGIIGKRNKKITIKYKDVYGKIKIKQTL